MDFLTLVVVYCVVFVVDCLCILYRDAKILTTGPVGMLRNTLVEYLTNMIPSPILRGLSVTVHYLLFERNCVFQLIFLVLALLAHAVFLIDMLPILHHYYPEKNHTFWPFVALFLNYICFHKAWVGDPGVITAKTLGKYKAVYEYDGAMYMKSHCRTCNIVRPARSKHCNACNRCVHRFDHHCIWTNNCVGGLNHRYFILFMVTLAAMFLQGIYVGTECVLIYAERIRLWEASYEGKDGQIHPMTASVAFQHLFISLPRLMFLVIALVALTVLVSVFLGQHIYYVLVNQTTNERHKMEVLLTQSRSQHHCDNNHGKQPHSGNNSQYIPSKGHKMSHIAKGYRPYDRGVVKNILEVFLPFHFISRAKLKGH